MYLLQISYQLRLFSLVFPRDLVGDHIRVIFGLHPGGSHLYGEDHSDDEGLVLRMVVTEGELKV